MGHTYANYDDWKLENPWDGQARMEGKPFYTEPDEDEEDEETDEEDF
jgi:hypothetical protein